MSVTSIDTFSYTAPSRVKVLLVPINGCSRRDFDNYVDIIRSDGSEIRLLDLTPQPNLHHFNPQTFPQGQIRFDFITSIPDAESIFLYDFEPYRKVFIVIGVGKFVGITPNGTSNGASKSTDTIVDSNTHDSDHYDSINASLSHSHPTSIVHNSILFDTPQAQLPPQSDHSSKNTYFCCSEGPTNIQTIMCGIGENFVTSLENYASSYANITLRSPVSLNSSSQMLPMTIAKAQKRLSSGSSISSASASFISNGAGSMGNGGTGSGTAGGIGMIDKSKLQQRQSGRQAKLMGNFCLLAGKYSDALNYFNESCLLLKKCDDYLWLASSLEGIGITTILLQYLAIHYQLPTYLLHNILQIPKGKFTSIDEASSVTTSTTRNSSTTASRHSMESKVSSTKRTSIYSPRNSNSSFVNFQQPTTTGASATSTANGEVVDTLPTTEFIKYVSNKVFSLFQLSTNDFENLVPDTVYIDSILRYVKFMVYVYVSGECNGFILEKIVKSWKFDKGSSNKIASQDTTFTKIDIIKELDKIFQLQLIDLNSTQQFKVYCTLASMYGDLDLNRKKAFILRILLVGVLPKIKHQHELEAHVRKELDTSVFAANEVDNSFGFRDILQSLFISYNIDTPSWNSLQIPLLKTCLEISEIIKDWSNSIKICSILLSKYVHCLDSEDQFSIKEKFDRLIYYSRRNNLSIHTDYWDPFLVRKVQFISKAKEDLVQFSEYLKNGNVASNSKISKSFIFNPYNKESKKAFDKDKIAIVDDVYQLKITLQNPFGFEIEINELEIVTEEGSVKVQTLKNLRPASTTAPMAQSQPNIPSMKRMVSSFSKQTANSKVRPTRIATLSAPILATAATTAATASSFSSSSLNSQTNLVGNSIRQFIVSFIPLGVEDLKIAGFNISVSNCSNKFFKVIENDAEAINLKSEEENSIKPNSKSTLRGSSLQNTLEDNKLSLMVIKKQPSLSLTNISISNGWLMLLQGEKFKFSIQLTNQSTELINYLSFSFWDSTIEPLNHKLSSSNNLPASEVYELEWNLLKFKSFEILNKDEISSKYKQILPQTDLTIDYEITGKKGMKESKMILEYSNKELATGGGATDEKDALERSFVKYVHVPIQLTILPSIEIIGCDFLPILETSLDEFTLKQQGQNEKQYGATNTFNKLVEFLEGSTMEKTSNFCLLIIDFRNSWSDRLEVRLNYQIDKETNFSVDEIIEPQKTIRVFIPINRISSISNDLTKPIPSLTSKQFIKNYSMSEQEEINMRELFWLRESVLNNLAGSWRTPNSERTGILDLRNIRLNNKMAKILMKPKIQIVQTVHFEETGAVVEKVGSKYNLIPEEFYTIQTTIHNNSLKDIFGILRHIPIPSDCSSSGGLLKNNPVTIDRRILIHGVLQKKVGIVEKGESKVVQLGFTILEKGLYEWGSIFEEVSLHLEGEHQVISSEPIIFSA